MREKDNINRRKNELRCKKNKSENESEKERRNVSQASVNNEYLLYLYNY